MSLTFVPSPFVGGDPPTKLINEHGTTSLHQLGIGRTGITAQKWKWAWLELHDHRNNYLVFLYDLHHQNIRYDLIITCSWNFFHNSSSWSSIVIPLSLWLEFKLGWACMMTFVGWVLITDVLYPKFIYKVITMIKS